MSGIFAGANEAELMGQKGLRLSSFLGRHIVKIGDVEAGVAKGKNKGKAFYGVKLEIAKSTNPQARGVLASWAAVKSHEWPEYFFSDVKRFLAAVAGVDPASVKEASMLKSASAAQPAKGRYVGATVMPTDKRDKEGKIINDVVFFQADLNTELGEDLPEAANEDAEASTAAGEDEPIFG